MNSLFLGQEDPSIPINKSVAPISLGFGNDLDPNLGRWLLTGGITGFLLWALASPANAPLHAFLHQRGPTQVFCLIMGGMLLAFIFFKWKIIKYQQQKFSILDQKIFPLIESRDLNSLAIQSEQSKSLLGKRILRVLSIWQSTQSPFQLERTADSDLELYELSAQSSYSLPKVLIWAIPLLGFIGTVIGMSQAVGSFDQVLGNADNVDGLKDGLTQVTSGLGTAFDTTYLALVLSVIFAFPLNSCERLEERLLSQIDGSVREVITYINTSSIMKSGQNNSESAGLLDLYAQTCDRQAPSTANELVSFQTIIEDSFERHLPDPSVLVQPAQAYAEKLTEDALEKLQPLTKLVRDSVEGISEARLSLQDQSEVIRSSLDGLASELTKSLTSLETQLKRLEQVSSYTLEKGEQLDQLRAMIDLRHSIDALSNLLQSNRKPKSPHLRKAFQSFLSRNQ